jgi:hypothetical protein
MATSGLSEQAEEAAEQRQPARFAERQAWLAGCPDDRLYVAPHRLPPLERL